MFSVSSLANRLRFWSRRPPAQAPRRGEPVTGNRGLLDGQYALVTGGGRNIGRAIVLEMLRQGAQVVYTDRDPERCAQLEADLTPYSDRIRGFVADVSRPEDNVRLVEALDRSGITIDVLVNNVGIQFAPRSILEFEWDEYRTIFDTNVIGPVHLTRLITERMIARVRPGAVIFMISLHAHSVVRRPSYSASKGALVMIVRELAVDLAAHRIRVNGIAPGWVWQSEEAEAVPYPYVPLYHSTVTPDYVARAACFLASDDFSHHTTGTILTVDGGLSLFNHILADDPAFKRP
jgi:NAD(P)-dependent dehydrogenase (short-subunit alcohol dehydrogenase family)